jgi:hypothetical protein
MLQADGLNGQAAREAYFEERSFFSLGHMKKCVF